MEIDIEKLRLEEDLCYSYDKEGRITEIVDINNSNYRTTYTYERLEDGTLVQKECSSFDEGDKTERTYFYNKKGLLVKEVVDDRVVEFFYDEKNKLIKQVSNDSLLERFYKDDLPTKANYYEKDKKGEMFLLKEGEFSEKGDEYIEQRHSSEPGSHKDIETVIITTYNKRGQIAKRHDVNNGSLDEYFYDVDDRLIFERNKNRSFSCVTEYEYDKKDVLLKETTIYEDGRVDVTTYEYSKSGGKMIGRKSYVGVIFIKAGNHQENAN